MEVDGWLQPPQKVKNPKVLGQLFAIVKTRNKMLVVT